jgi:hypothetical protein
MASSSGCGNVAVRCLKDWFVARDLSIMAPPMGTGAEGAAT